MGQEHLLGKRMEQVNQLEKKWTREHDAVIAEKVEGLKITTERFSAGVEGRTTTWNRYFYNNPDWGMIEIPSYNEPKHFFRALEKWREGGVGRCWYIESGFHSIQGERYAMICRVRDSIQVFEIVEHGPNAPSWALYKAVVDEV